MPNYVIVSSEQLGRGAAAIMPQITAALAGGDLLQSPPSLLNAWLAAHQADFERIAAEQGQGMIYMQDDGATPPPVFPPRFWQHNRPIKIEDFACVWVPLVRAYELGNVPVIKIIREFSSAEVVVIECDAVSEPFGDRLNRPYLILLRK